MQLKDVLYTRFSSDMQRNESCEDQERDVRQGLAKKGIDAANFEVLNDRAASGTKNERVIFDQPLARIRRGEVGILAVDDQSRFSRADNAFSFITDIDRTSSFG
jgi:site-specific DNA recombinase